MGESQACSAGVRADMVHRFPDSPTPSCFRYITCRHLVARLALAATRLALFVTGMPQCLGRRSVSLRQFGVSLACERSCHQIFWLIWGRFSQTLTWKSPIGQKLWFFLGSRCFVLVPCCVRCYLAWPLRRQCPLRRDARCFSTHCPTTSCFVVFCLQISRAFLCCIHAFQS